MILKAQQQAALSAMESFLKDTRSGVFILKGYAGTGKTTLLTHLLPVIEKQGKTALLMAPTGRAAKVLSGKTGREASTIHKSIYSIESSPVLEQDSAIRVICPEKDDDDASESEGVDNYHLFFKIKDNGVVAPQQMVVIVDEASMVSSKKCEGDYLHFGTDVLLDDLLTFANTLKGAKIIFVGDPAQLPPVGDNFSAALEEEYFRAKGIGVKSFTLTEVLRQDGASAILRNAMKVRSVLESAARSELEFDEAVGEVERISQAEVIDAYTRLHPVPEAGNSMVVCYTNALAKEYNDLIRQIYFPGVKSVMPGDVLQVVKNNYSHRDPIYNGDFVKVLSVDGEKVTHTTRVTVHRDGKKMKEDVSIDFVPVTLLTEEGMEFKCHIIDTLLQSNDSSLKPYHNIALYVDYKIRNWSSLKQDPGKMTSDMLSDPFLNAIHAKFGYAITGHKSQGGEWPTAFVDYTKKSGMDDDSLRWIYTATTRASAMLYGVNMPKITPFDKLKINPVVTLASPLDGAFAYADVECAMMPGARAFQKVKCNSIAQNLEAINCRIISVKQLQYCDRYEIATPEGKMTADLRYNKSGTYTSHNILKRLGYAQLVGEALDARVEAKYEVNYQPTNAVLTGLHHKVVSLSDELGITITNILCHEWDVVYCFATSGKFSHIKFYFNNKYAVTSAMPASDLGENDTLLNKLIQRLS